MPRIANPIVVWIVLLAVLPLQSWADQPPNILIVYADDMGFGDLGIQNSQSKIPTPNLDQLAGQGMLFTDAHSSSGICTPSRYALLSGRYHWRKFHKIVNSWEPSVFEPKQLTLPRMLKQKGYTTACIGKWHLGFQWDAIVKPDAKPVIRGRQKVWSADAFDWTKSIPGGPLDHGFDYYFGDDVPNFPPYAWIENDRVTQAPTVEYVPDPRPSEGAAEGRPGPMVAGWKQDQVMPTLTKRVTRWITERQGQKEPFFLYWAWTSPHAPIVPVKQWQGKTAAGGYGDFLAQSDDHLGDVLKALSDNGFAENTIVIFTADNGPENYAYPRVRNFQHRSMGELRGLKRDIWEGGHRVPFIIRWPNVVKPGTVTSDLISQVDLMATLAKVVDFQLPAGTAEDSFNQLDLWQGGKSQRTSIVHNTKANHYAIREGDWVLVDAPTGAISSVPDWFDLENGYTKNGLPAALYDLSNDLSQRKNLLLQYPEKVTQLRQLLKKTQAAGEVR